MRSLQLTCVYNDPGFQGRERRAKWISRKAQHNGDWHYWFSVELSPGEGDRDYHIAVNVVSPEAAANDLPEAMCAMGWGEPPEKWTQAQLVEALVDYGVSALLWYKRGSNYRELLKEARNAIRAASFLFGFYMDRPVNALGATGWDAIAGRLWPNEKRKKPRDRSHPGMEGSVAAIAKLLAPLQKTTQAIQKAQGIATEPESCWWSSSSGRIELCMTRAQAESVSHPGECYTDAYIVTDSPAIRAQLERIPDHALFEELRDYGFWDSPADEWKNFSANRRKHEVYLVWIAGNDIVERADEEAETVHEEA